jgi:hypothetical protein
MSTNRLFNTTHDDFQEHDTKRENLGTVIQYISQRVNDPDERNHMIAETKAKSPEELATLAGWAREEWARAEIIQLRQTDDRELRKPNAPEQEAPEHADKNEYTIVENFVIDHPELGGKEIAIYCLLVYRAHMPKKTCIASIAGLARRTGWTRDTISKALDKLVEVGAVEPGDRQPGGAYLWTLPHRNRSKPKKAKR